MTDAEFEKIYMFYFSDIYRYILVLSGNKHVAEDITSETFFKAMCTIDSFRCDCNIRSWLYQIAKNSYYSYLRKNRKVDFVEELPDKFNDCYISLEEQLESQDASLRIHEILHKLDEPYKEVFLLRFIRELSFKQISESFNKSENWACVTYHRARKKIQSEMEDYQ